MRSNRLVTTIVSVVGVLVVLALAWTLRLRTVEGLPIDYDEDDYLRARHLISLVFQRTLLERMRFGSIQD